MDDSALNSLVEEYIQYTEWFASTTSMTEKMNPPVELEECHWEQAFSSPDLWWRFIKMASERRMPDQVFSVLAAGPLEDFLASYGPEYIEEVEFLAKQSPSFNNLLGGVWQNSIDANVWERVQKARDNVW
jgi:hypothetical protein